VPPSTSVEADLHENEKNAEQEDITTVPPDKGHACCSLSGAHGGQYRLLYVTVSRGEGGVPSLGRRRGGGEWRPECWPPEMPLGAIFFVCTYFQHPLLGQTPLAGGLCKLLLTMKGGVLVLVFGQRASV